MKQALRAFFILGITLCFVVPVMAVEKNASKPKINFFAGEVKSIDAKTKTIVIKREKEEKSIVCTDKTVMQSGKSKVTFADIKKGDIAAVIYDVVDGKNVAKNITFHSTQGEPAAGQKAKP